MNPKSKINESEHEWRGNCSGCGDEISRQKAPPQCHVKRLKCKQCKLKAHTRHTREWCRRNKQYERERKQTPHRKAMSVKYNLNQNRISQSKATMTHQPWGIVDDCWLLENVGKLTNAKMGEYLGRSIKSIEVRLWRLRNAETETSKTK